MPPTNRANPHESDLRRAIFAPVLAVFLSACAPDAPAPSAHPEEARAPVSANLVTLDLQVPTAGWTLEPVAAYRLPDEIWVVHQLRAPEGMAAQVVSTVSAAVELPAHDLPIRHFVLGKTWNWNANPEVRFIDSLQSLQPKLGEATRLPINPAR